MQVKLHIMSCCHGATQLREYGVESELVSPCLVPVLSEALNLSDISHDSETRPELIEQLEHALRRLDHQLQR